MACSLWPSIKANRLELTPLGDDELWAAIVEPANQVGVTVDEALAVKLIADAAGQKGVLPLVQETLVLLWDKVAERQLGLKAYQAMAQDGRSGLQVAIDRRASIVYDNLPAAAQAIARRIFLRLVQFGEGRADTRRQQTATELQASGDDSVLLDQTLAILTASRLLTTSGEVDGVRRVDIAHEALIAGWPRLQEWLGQRRTAEQTRRRLEAKAVEWVAADKRGGLLDEYELQEAERWLESEDAGELGHSQELADLVQTSREALAQAAVAQEAQRQRELEQAQQLAAEQRLRAEEGERAARGLRTRFRFAVAAATVALILLGVAGVAVRQAAVAQDRAEAEAFEAERQRSASVAAQATAVASADEAERSRQLALRGQFEADYQRQLAEERQLEAEARSLAAQSERLQEQDPALALLLAGEAAQQPLRAGKAPPVEVVSTLHRLLATPHAQLLRDIKAQDAHVWSIALWPDGTKFVTAGCDQRLSSGACQSGQARVWRSDGALLAEFASRPTDLSLAVVSPDGERILTADDQGSVQLWAAGDLREIAALPGYTGTLSTAAFSPDSQRILTVGEREPARLWDAQGQLVAALDAATERTYSAVFSLDGQRIASSHCTSLGDNQTCAAGYARLWDADGRPLSQFAQGAGVRWVSFGPGGVMVSAECAELANSRCIQDRVRVWDPAGRLLGALEGRRFLHPLRHVEFDASGARVLAYSATEAALWTSAGELLEQFDAPANHLWTVRFSPDGQLVMITSSGPDPDRFNQYKTLIQLWSRDGEFLLDLPARHEGFVKATAMTTNHGRLLTAGLDGLVQIWDTGSVAGTLQGQRAGHGGFLLTATYSPDGSRLATVADDGVRLWDAEGNLLAHLETRAPQVYAARFSRQGDLLATLACDVLTQNIDCARGALRLWDADGAPVREVSGYRFAGGYDFAPDGSRMATAGEGSTAQVVDASGHQLAVLTGHTGAVNRVAYSPDGTRIATSSDDGTVRIWDAGGQPLMTLSGHTGPTRGVLFGAAKGAIMTYGDDGSIRLWSDDGQLLHVLDGHPGGVKFATFNRTGTLILAESNDGPARLWDLDGNLVAVLGENAAWVDVAVFDPAGERIMTVECNAVNEGDWCIRHSVNLWDTHGEFITTMDDHWVEWAVFHPSSRQIVTAGCDTFEPPTNTRCLAGGVWLWQAYPDVDALLAEAATRAGRALTPAECQQYLGQEQCP
jgi:WD40 repeat protein